jgi:hypothetical protein
MSSVETPVQTWPWTTFHSLEHQIGILARFQKQQPQFGQK